MLSIADSKAIRNKFGTYFLGGIDKRPTELKPYSIKNKVTPETKIRISILKLMAKRYRDSNPGSRFGYLFDCFEHFCFVCDLLAHLTFRLCVNSFC